MGILDGINNIKDKVVGGFKKVVNTIKEYVDRGSGYIGGALKKEEREENIDYVPETKYEDKFLNELKEGYKEDIIREYDKIKLVKDNEKRKELVLRYLEYLETRKEEILREAQTKINAINDVIQEVIAENKAAVRHLKELYRGRERGEIESRYFLKRRGYRTTADELAKYHTYILKQEGYFDRFNKLFKVFFDVRYYHIVYGSYSGMFNDVSKGARVVDAENENYARMRFAERYGIYFGVDIDVYGEEQAINYAIEQNLKEVNEGGGIPSGFYIGGYLITNVLEVKKGDYEHRKDEQMILPEYQE